MQHDVGLQIDPSVIQQANIVLHDAVCMLGHLKGTVLTRLVHKADVLNFAEAPVCQLWQSP